MITIADRRLFMCVASFVISSLALVQFLRDVFHPTWPHWMIASLLVVALLWLLPRFDHVSSRMHAIHQGLFATIVFAAVYDALDLVIGPDWILWFVCPIVLVLIYLAVIDLTESRDYV